MKHHCFFEDEDYPSYSYNYKRFTYLDFIFNFNKDSSYYHFVALTHLQPPLDVMPFVRLTLVLLLFGFDSLNRHQIADRSPQRFNGSQLRGLAPAGRLDIDSTGLLVLTQDGRVARQLIGEDSEVEKEYLVRVSWEQGQVSQNVQAAFPPEKLALLKHGLALDGQALKPARVEWENPEQLRFVLKEGKKRQIRRMCEQVGLKVVGLKRIRMGRVTLGQLPAGQWRYLAPHERF